MRYVTLLLLLPVYLLAQSSFSPEAYEQFLKDNADMTASHIIERYEPDSPFYNSRSDQLYIEKFAFLDSIEIKYGLTADEKQMLQDNHFVVSERLSYDCFGRAMHDIYENDLPVFITTDAILYALHFSYDRILLDIEKTVLEDKLRKVLDGLYFSVRQLQNNYADYPELVEPLKDVDIYITIAKSLLDEKLTAPNFADKGFAEELWNAIDGEQMTFMPLFSERDRRLDFSQFTVRGHYTHEFWGENGKRSLGNYFQAMMWLGRMDFYLTPPPVGPDELPWTRDEIRRMMAGALLMNELLDMAGVRAELNTIDDIITFMVGESDNLTPTELSTVVAELGVTPTTIFDDAVYDALQNELVSEVVYGQRIMSAFFIVDPFSNTPDELPVSYRLSGQRFIIDSYVLANVVYDRIIFQDEKVWRPMPDPLDAMFILGNDNALPLLQKELEAYKYASQLEALRYLVDAYDDDFWGNSLYNTWLQGIRSLNPSEQENTVPYFMNTVAWQQQKLNTQLSSWAQLRHDNLLYAKQSYTGGTSCSYPHSFVEPYPEFYQQLALFAEKAELHLLPILSENGWETFLLKQYFPKLKEISLKLQTLAEKELAQQAFNETEIDWLKRMLFIDGMSGAPPFSGWYADLFYHLEMVPGEQYEGHDYLVADVHTQPTDAGGNVVGRVLHVGIGEVNLGIYLADAPSAGYSPMAYVGPVMSYYEKITSNFERLTDEKWGELVEKNDLPQRPDWVNVYLADEQGNTRAEGRELPGTLYIVTDVNSETVPNEFVLRSNYPNPFNPSTSISYTLPHAADVTLTIYDLRGQQVAHLVNQKQDAGKYEIQWNAQNFSSGIYIARIQAADFSKSIKMMLVK